MSAIRGLFQFALDMGASDVMFNPAKNVKVKAPKHTPAKEAATNDERRPSEQPRIPLPPENPADGRGQPFSIATTYSRAPTLEAASVTVRKLRS